MRSFYLSLAVLVLAANPLEAVKTSGLLRQRQTHSIEDRRLSSKGSDDSKGGKGSKGQAGDDTGVTAEGGCDYVVPTCEAPTGTTTTSTTTTTSSSGKGKGGKGGKGSKGSRRGRFLEEEEFAEEMGRALRYKGGKGDASDVASTGSSKGKGGSKGEVSGGTVNPSSDDAECCGEPTNQCPIGDPDQTVKCFDTIDTYKTLKTSLGCADADSMMNAPPVITVKGPDGVLDCSGHGNNQIYDPTPESSSSSVGIRLMDGGKLINCHVAGFQVGVQMMGNGNNAVIGSTIYDVGYGIETAEFPVPSGEDVGCYSISCTTIVGAANEGIVVGNGGQMIITNTDVLGSRSTGIRITPSEINKEVYVALSDVNVFGTSSNNAHGIIVGKFDDMASFGDVTVEIFELTKIIGAGQNGYFQTSPFPGNPQLRTIVTGALDVQGSVLDGIRIESGTWSVGECGAVEACTSQTNKDDTNVTAPVDPSRQYKDFFFGTSVSDDDYENLGTQLCEISDPDTKDGAPVCSENLCSTDISIALACGPPAVVTSTVEVGEDVCDTCGKPISFIGTYTGIDAPVGESAQSNKAYVVNEGSPVSAQDCVTLTLVDTKKKDELILKLPPDQTQLCPGDQFVVSSSDGDKLPAETNMLFTWSTGSQMVSFHTSCSAPFLQGDRVGVFELTGYTGQEGCGFSP